MNTDKKRSFKLKRGLIVLCVLTIAFLGYVEIINLDSKNMTYRQKFLKTVYPVLMWITKVTGKNSDALKNTAGAKPAQSFYSLSIPLGNGKTLDCSTLRGKKLLLVNTASDCGYTNQFDALQKLYETHQNKLVIIGFPANDFKEQEKGTDTAIEQFCKINFGVTFPLAAKTVVIKSPAQSPLFQWLSDKAKNGWNEQAPSWNFCKYVVDESGTLTHFFASSVSPAAAEVTAAIQ